MQKWIFIGIAGLALFLFQPTYAQKEGSVWYFGNRAGLDFNGQYPKPLINGQTQSSEGVAVISDSLGNLLFYTDGQTVFTSNQIMQNGTGLFGNNTSAQSSIIVPWPEHPGKYYVFTVGKVGTVALPGKGLYYSIVDMNTRQVDLANFNVKLLDLCTEKVTAIQHGNGVDWWILAHQIDNSVFVEFKLTNALLQQNQVIEQTIGLKHPVDRDNPADKGASGYLKASPNGDLVALAIEGYKFFEVFKFNNTTGELLQNPAPVKLQTESAYGVEFSPTGKYLYGTNRQDGMIYRWKLDLFAEQSVKNSREIIETNPRLKFGALQLALNGKIYIALDKKPYLGVINAPDLDSCGYVEKGASLYDYATKFKGICGFGLPNIPTLYSRQKIYSSNTCANDTTSLYLASTDLFDWAPDWFYIENDVPIPISAGTFLAKFAFKIPGDYLIRALGQKNLVKTWYDQTIRIHPLPVLNINDTTYLCAGQPVNLHDGQYAFYGIIDEAGDYADSIRSIDQPGLYKIRATNYQGCTDTASTRAVSIQQPEIVSITVTPVLCSGTNNGTITIVMKGTLTDYKFVWKDGSPDTNFRDSLAPGKYGVIISIQDGCPVDTTITVETSKLEVKINRLPKDKGPVCPGTGLPITLTATGADTYFWDHEPLIQQDSVLVSPDTTMMYWVTGSNKEGTCFGRDSIQIGVFPNYKLDLGPDTTACAGSTIILRGKNLEFGSKYVEWNWSTSQTTDSLVVTNTIQDLQLSVKDLNGCFYSDVMNIDMASTLNVKIATFPDITGPVCMGSEIILTARGAESFVWEHAPASKENPISVRLTRDTTFRVTGTNGGQCFGYDSISIRVSPEYKLNMGPDTTVCSGKPLVLHGKDYLYGSLYTTWRWSTGETGDSLVVLHSLPNLTLTVTDINGCTYADDINIIFNPVPVISDIIKNDIVCFGDKNGSVEIKVDGDASKYQYSLDKGNTWSNKRLYTDLPAGDYTAMVKYETGCISQDTTVTISEPGQLNYEIKSIAPTCENCTDGEIQVLVTGGVQPYSIEWEGFSNQGPVLSQIGAKTYTITLTDGNGCTTVFDYALLAGEFFIPNAFSPNGGTKNEKWMIRILDNRPDCLVQVFDRSGKVVFYRAGYYVPWDGTYLNQGKELPAGTYFYVIQVDVKNTNMPPQRGTVTILR